MSNLSTLIFFDGPTLQTIAPNQYRLAVDPSILASFKHITVLSGRLTRAGGVPMPLAVQMFLATSTGQSRLVYVTFPPSGVSFTFSNPHEKVCATSIDPGASFVEMTFVDRNGAAFNIDPPQILLGLFQQRF